VNTSCGLRRNNIHILFTVDSNYRNVRTCDSLAFTFVAICAGALLTQFLNGRNTGLELPRSADRPLAII
jgi:hypothetical protein